MKRIFSVFLILLFLLTGCRAVVPVDLPQRTPEPTPTPTVTPTPAPTPEPTPEPISVPETLDELSETVGVGIYSPAEPIVGMKFTSIGYDGKASGALKYTNDEGGSLIYTVTDGIIAPTFSDCFKITVNGMEVSILPEENSTEAFTGAYWVKNSNTYQLFCDPSCSEDDIHSAVSAMILAPQNAKAPSKEVSSAEELSSVVGFSAEEPSALPKGYSLKHMYALYGQIPVWIYSNDNTELTFIKSEGTLLPPRFNKIEYASAGEYELPDGTKAYLYYTENGISLAEWTLGGYGYSISAADTDGNPIDLKKKTFLPLIDGFFEGTAPQAEQ